MRDAIVQACLKRRGLGLVLQTTSGANGFGPKNPRQRSFDKLMTVILGAVRNFGRFQAERCRYSRRGSYPGSHVDPEG
jgi:hypothetical protein